jgi:hypothetical protein
VAVVVLKKGKARLFEAGSPMVGPADCVCSALAARCWLAMHFLLLVLTCACMLNIENVTTNILVSG